MKLYSTEEIKDGKIMNSPHEEEGKTMVMQKNQKSQLPSQYRQHVSLSNISV